MDKPTPPRLDPEPAKEAPPVQIPPPVAPSAEAKEAPPVAPDTEAKEQSPPVQAEAGPPPPSTPEPEPKAADSAETSAASEISSTKQFTRAEIQGIISKIQKPAEKPAPPPSAKGILRLQLVDGSYSLNIPIVEKITLGRNDPSNMRPVQGDFGNYAGYRMGVSRMHAEIHSTPQDNLLKLMDLGSSNGTFLNGNRLEANRHYPLYNGDEIRLGQLAIYVYYEIEFPVHVIPVRPRA
jgi:hypothetical protein